MVWKVYGVFLIVIVLAFAKHEICFVQRLFLGNKIIERGWGGELVPRRTLKATRSCKQLIKRLISKLIDLRNLARPLFFYCGRFFVFFSCDRILEQTPFFPRIVNSSSPRHFFQLFFFVFSKKPLYIARDELRMEKLFSQPMTHSPRQLYALNILLLFFPFLLVSSPNGYGVEIHLIEADVNVGGGWWFITRRELSSARHL